MDSSAQAKFKSGIELLSDKVLELLQDCEDRGTTIIPSSWAETAAQTGINSYEPKQMVEIFLQKSVGHWPDIKTRKETALINQVDEIFAGLSFDTGILGKFSLNSKIFNQMLTAKDKRGKLIVMEYDKDEIWDYLESLVNRSIQYIEQEHQSDSQFMVNFQWKDQGLNLSECIAQWRE